MNVNLQSDESTPPLPNVPSPLQSTQPLMSRMHMTLKVTLTTRHNDGSSDRVRDGDDLLDPEDFEDGAA